MKKSLLILSLGLALFAANAQADMTYAPFMFDACDASGNAIANGTYVMVLDLDGDGVNGASYLSQASTFDNSSTWLWDTDDLILDRGLVGVSDTSLAGEAYPFSKLLTASIPATYTANVDHIYLLWFDVAYDAAATGPGAGIAYGVEDLGTVGTDPGDYNFFPVGGSASLTTVPEPVTTALLLIGGGLLAARRRRAA